MNGFGIGHDPMCEKQWFLEPIEGLRAVFSEKSTSLRIDVEVHGFVVISEEDGCKIGPAEERQYDHFL